MPKLNNPKIYTVDASGKPLGRMATEIATLLRGKREVSYTPYLDPKIGVKVTNFDKVVLTGKKSTQKTYRHYTGYMGGLKKEKLSEVVKKDRGRILRLAVLRMLNKNRLRSKLIRRLIIE